MGFQRRSEVTRFSTAGAFKAPEGHYPCVRKFELTRMKQGMESFNDPVIENKITPVAGGLVQRT